MPMQDPDLDSAAANMEGRPYMIGGDGTLHIRYNGMPFYAFAPQGVARLEPSHIIADDYACNPHKLPANFTTDVPVPVNYSCNKHMLIWDDDTYIPMTFSVVDLQQNPQGCVRISSGVHSLKPTGTTYAWWPCQRYNGDQTPSIASLEKVNTGTSYMNIPLVGRSRDGRLSFSLNGNMRQPPLKRGATRPNSRSKSQPSTDATAATVTKKQDRPVSGGVDYLGKPLLLPSEPLLDNHFPKWF